MHDAEFRQAENDWKSFVEKLTEKLAEIDDTVPELPVKDVVRMLEVVEATRRPNCKSVSTDLQDISRHSLFARSYALQGAELYHLGESDMLTHICDKAHFSVAWYMPTCGTSHLL